jgi:hypothetical protein
MRLQVWIELRESAEPFGRIERRNVFVEKSFVTRLYQNLQFFQGLSSIVSESSGDMELARLQAGDTGLHKLAEGMSPPRGQEPNNVCVRQRTDAYPIKTQTLGFSQKFANPLAVRRPPCPGTLANDPGPAGW